MVKERMKGSGRLTLAALFALGTAGACTANGPAAPGSLNWFDACDVDGECASGLCACGVCTQLCEQPDSCSDTGGATECVQADSTGLRCADMGPAPSPGVCLKRCQGDADCGSGMQCFEGACVRGSTLLPTPDDETEDPPHDERPDPSDFSDVSVPMDFTEPVALPMPDTTFSGDASSLEGLWVELNFDGGPCTPENPGPDVNGSVCTRIEIRSTGGGFTGTLYKERSLYNESPVSGPFAPVTDPAVGYPVELTPEDYGHARSAIPGVNYRLFDGLVQDGRLTFWFSPLDLWTDWCAQQSPHVWDVSGKREYRCVPQSADEADTDLGKLVLCTSAEDMNYCDDAYSLSYPCACLDDESQFDFGLPLCGLNYCECSATECHAALRGTTMAASFRMEGDSLVGIAGGDVFSGAITLVKVSP
jgi:hypothetical protein